MRKEKQVVKCVVALVGLAVFVPLSGMAQGFSTSRNVFGGFDYHPSGQPGVTFGSSMPNVFGGQDFRYRGASDESVLFADDEIAKLFPEAAWLDATDARDVPQMTQLAWTLKGLETVLGETDEDVTSEMMFDAAAQLAVAQGNADALEDIVALSPAAAKYKGEMAALATTRGKGGFVSGMPQIVMAPKTPKEFNKFMAGIKGHQVPFVSPAVLAAKLPKATAPEVLNICTLVNQGRITKSPSMITLAALELAQASGSTKRAFLNPSRMIEEAAELAILKDDKTSLDFIANIYGQPTSPLANKSKAAMYAAEAVAMSKTRGMSSLTTFEKLVLPPSYFDFLTDSSPLGFEN